jgi:hypothetical protein
MQNLKWLPIILVSLSSLLAAEEAGTELQIKKFRFNRHNKLRFERLVIEFSSKLPSKEIPTLRLIPDKSGKETIIHINKASLIGAIPESAINESYTNKSQYFGPISINTDTSSGFDIRTFIKQSHSLVDAFWLEKPARLIVDVYPKDSARAGGPNVAIPRETASGSADVAVTEKNGHKPEKVAKAEKEFTPMEKPQEDLVLCFPANSLVKADVGFEKGSAKNGAQAPVSIDKTYAAAAASLQNNIVCYPKSAQVTPLLKFQPSENNYFGRADMDNVNGATATSQGNHLSQGAPASRLPSFAPQVNPGYQQGQPSPMGNGYPNPNNNGYFPQQSMPMNSQPLMPMNGQTNMPMNSQWQRMAPQSSLAAPSPYASREDVINNEADLALASPEEVNLRAKPQASPQSYQDSFSQKPAPLSLGKKLFPQNSNK